MALTQVNAGLIDSTSQPNAFKNRIINGAMIIDQRNAGASITPTNQQYAVDRWKCWLSQASKYSIQQNAGSVTPPAGFVNYLGVTSLSSYSIGASDQFNITQPVEGFNVADLGWGTSSAAAITVSFWARSSLTGTFGGAVFNAAPNRSYPFTFQINSTNTWEYKTVTITGDTSGTWAKDNSVGLYLSFGFGVGSASSGTAGSWASAAYVSATGATSVVGTNGATFYITGVQLEKGSTATSFDYRPYGTELTLCQRYYEVMTNDANGYSVLSSLLTITGTSNWANWQYKQTKRATPTIALISGNSWINTTPTITQSISGAYFSSNTYFYNAGTVGGLGISASAEI